MTDNTILKPFLFSDNEVNCSSEEQNTGLKWIDGKDIFQKTIYYDELTSANIEVMREISDLDMDIVVNLRIDKQSYVVIQYTKK